MDEYLHPLFFEASELTGADKEKIRRYFQKRREVGGGECGVLEKVGDKTYKICFKERQDQERVSKKKVHTIQLQSGEFQVNVSPISPLQHPEHTPPSSCNNSQTAKGQENLKIIHLDIFILFYLRDTPEALKVLKKQLSSIECAVELDIDEETAVVKGPEGAFGGSAEKWEQRVDRIFANVNESYVCHHVLEAKQMKMLLQDLSFVNDSIKVYTQSGYAVIAGRVEAVNERLAILEKNQPIQKELAIAEKTLQLVEDEFRREMHEKYPEVQISTRPGTMILKGHVKEVQAGASKLDDLTAKIIEKRVLLPKDVITFITTGEVISKYQARFQQSLKNPVSIEVGPDLVLSSLSPDALDEAEAALRRDIIVESVNLEAFSAVPQDLKRVMDALMEAKNKANRDEHRVDVYFFPGSGDNLINNVQLIGFSENVREVKEVLQDYQMNQITTQEVLNLPHPELVDCFDQILTLIGMSKTGVSLKVSNVPYPSVLVSGPSSLVQKVQADLNTKLAGLTLETLVLKGPGVQWYFEGASKSKKLVENSCRVMIREQQPTQRQSTGTVSKPSSKSGSSSIPSTSSHQRNSPPTTVFLNKTSVEIKIGSVIDFQVNVLVAPMISKKLSSTKIGKCLQEKGGKAMQKNFDSIVKKWRLSAGNVMIVDAPPSLNCSKIFFIECLPWDGAGGRSMQALRDGLKQCLNLCVTQGWSSVSLPVIGPGAALKYPHKEAVRVLTEEIQLFGSFALCGSLDTIRVVIQPGNPYFEECYQDVYRNLSRQNVNQQGQGIFRSVSSDLADITVTVGGNVQLQLRFGDGIQDLPGWGGNLSNVIGYQKGSSSIPSISSHQHNYANSPPTTVFLNKTTLKIKIGSVIDFKVNVLVAPMISKKLSSTNIGKCLQEKGGKAMQKNFDSRAKKWILSAGNVMIVDAPPSLNCSKIFFIECLPWDGAGGRSMQTLRDGLKQCLNLCVTQGWSSVSLPVIGPGAALKYPHKEAVQVLTEEIQLFGPFALGSSLDTIQVVIKPGYPYFEECYQGVYRHLSQNGNQRSQAFLTLTGDEDADIVENLMCGLIQNCESLCYKFVEIPIISTGTGGSDPDVLVRAVLCGVVTSSSSGLLRHLRNICLVLNQMDLFLAFKKGALEIFPSATIGKEVTQHAQPTAGYVNLSILCSRFSIQESTLMVVGMCRENVDRAASELKSLYEKECCTRTFREEELAGLSQSDLECLKQLLEVLDVQLEEEKSEPGRWTLSGLKDRVEQVTQILHP